MDTLICPITQSLFKDPVNAEDGHTYEKSAILEWFKTHKTSPITGLEIGNKLVPCFLIKHLVDIYIHEHPTNHSVALSEKINDKQPEITKKNKTICSTNINSYKTQNPQSLQNPHIQQNPQSLQNPYLKSKCTGGQLSSSDIFFKKYSYQYILFYSSSCEWSIIIMDMLKIYKNSGKFYFHNVDYHSCFPEGLQMVPTMFIKGQFYEGMYAILESGEFSNL